MNVSSTRAATAIFPVAGSRPVTASTPSGDNNEGYDLLSAADRELIFKTTGLQIQPGHDTTRDGCNIFASQLAFDRSAGRLSAGQEVGAPYLHDLLQRYQQPDGTNIFGSIVADALRELGNQPRRLDVTT